MENNVAVEVIEKIKENLKQELESTKITRRAINEIILNNLKQTIESLFDYEPIDILEKIKTSEKPYKILMLGVNGSGKTTTIGKLVKYFQDNNITCVVAAADTFRAAAIQQIEEHTNNLNTKLIKHDYGADPTAVAFDAVKYAKRITQKLANNETFILPSASVLAAVNLIKENRSLIQNETTTYIDTQYPNFSYDRVKCRRDVGYIVDNVITDLLYGGNERSELAGLYYFKFPSIANTTQLEETLEAIKYTKEGKIEISISSNKEAIYYCVEDTGRGVDPEILPNLFKKFSRGKGSFRVHTEGCGLGLYVAKMIVDAHSGKIWAESKGRDKGSRFCFSIPFKHMPKDLPLKFGEKKK
jgi:predicted ABC-type ATPase